MYALCEILTTLWHQFATNLLAHDQFAMRVLCETHHSTKISLSRACAGIDTLRMQLNVAYYLCQAIQSHHI